MVEPPVVLLPYNHALIKYFEICISPVTSGLIIAEWSLLKKKIQSYKVDVSVIPSKDYCRDLFSVEERTREGYRWGRQGGGISSIKIIPIESVKNIQIYFFDILSIRLS